MYAPRDPGPIHPPVTMQQHLAQLSREEWAALSWIRCTWSPPADICPVQPIDELTDFAILAAEAHQARLVTAGRQAEAQAPIVDQGDGTGPRWSPPAMLGICRARMLADEKIAEAAMVRGFWTRGGDGKPMACMPIVASLFAGAHDIAVFTDTPARRHQVWLLTGAATAQNEDEIAYGEGPLLLHADLVAWAQSGGEGAVIFDLKVWAPLLLELGRPIHCATVGIATELEKALKRVRPKLPPIGVINPTGSKRAA